MRRPVNFERRTGERLVRLVNGRRGDGRVRRKKRSTVPQTPTILYVCRLLENLPASTFAFEDDFYEPYPLAEEEYQTLWDYFNQLKDSNPDGAIDVDSISGFDEDQFAWLSEQLAEWLENDENTIEKYSGQLSSARAMLAEFDPDTNTFSITGEMIRVYNPWPIDFNAGAADVSDEEEVGLPFNSIYKEISGNMGWGWMAIRKGANGWWAAAIRKQVMLQEGVVPGPITDIGYF